MPAIIFDLGGTHIRCAVAPTCGNITENGLLHLVKQPMPKLREESRVSQVWGELLELIVRYVSRVAQYVNPQDPVVIAIAAAINSMGHITAASSIFGDEREFPDMRAMVSELTGRRVFLLNDMSAATWYLSTISDAQRFIAVTVSSGIGSKIFDRGSKQGVFDHLPFVGEIGHLVVSDDHLAPMCDCGIRGHLQGIASGRGIERAAVRHIRADPASFERSLCSRKFGASVESISNELHLVPSARAGDEWALGVIRLCTEPLGYILAVLIVAAGLDRIVITGGIPQSLGQVYVDLLVEAMRRHYTYPGLPFDMNIVQLCSADAEVPLLGAATYANLRLGVS